MALPSGPANLCLYIGFRGDIRAAGAGSANEWFYRELDMERGRHWEIGRDEEPSDAPVLYCSFPTLKDPSYDPGPDMRHTGEVLTFVPWQAFTPWLGTRWLRRGEDYEQFKSRLGQHLLDQLLQHKPGLRPYVDRVEVSTPLSTDFFTRALDGSVYGLEPTPERFQSRWLRPHSPVRGLYFAGSDVGTMGIMGAANGGVMAAAALMPRASLPYLRRLGL
jgi:all-trans-retinol 13,14-reductase